MEAMEILRLFLQQGHQVFRLRVTGIAAGNEHHINSRQLGKNFAPLFERELDGFRIGIIPIHRGIPDPDIQAVGIGEPRHARHHFHRRAREMRTVRVIIRTWRDQLDGVAAEDGEVAIVLFPDGQIPGVIGMGFRPVTELMAAQRIFGRGGNIHVVVHRHATALHVQFAQQPPDAEHQPARIVADDKDRRTRRPASDTKPVALGPDRGAHREKLLGVGPGELAQRGSCADGDHRHV